MKLKRIVISLLIFISWSLVISSCRSVTTYYVATSGNDVNPGSQSQPWKTIQKAAAVMHAGDTVLIHAGTYYEKVTPVKFRSGRKIHYLPELRRRRSGD